VIHFVQNIMSCGMFLSIKISSLISHSKYIQPLFTSFFFLSFLFSQKKAFFTFYSVPLPIVALILPCLYCLSLFGPCIINPSEAPLQPQSPLQRSYNFFRSIQDTNCLRKEINNSKKTSSVLPQEKEEVDSVAN
jgi:hypothetical protein